VIGRVAEEGHATISLSCSLPGIHNQSQAAKLLGIDRATLRPKIRSHNIAIERSVS
jgi:hypothetical protein